MRKKLNVKKATTNSQNEFDQLLRKFMTCENFEVSASVSVSVSVSVAMALACGLSS
jgi:hypothetical protein